MNIEVKKSPIHGKGIFATKDFKQNETILSWNTNNIISEKEYLSLPENEKRYVEYVNNVYIKMQEPEKYMNHSCSPNTISNNFSDIALIDIKKGDEILVNYFETLPKEISFDCNCLNTDCCKKVI